MNRRGRLYTENPVCYWCGEPTHHQQLPGGGTVAPEQATIDHLYSRRDPRRKQFPGAVVNAHSRCNYQRAAVENAAVEKLWRALMPTILGDKIIDLEPIDVDSFISSLLEKIQ